MRRIAPVVALSCVVGLTVGGAATAAPAFAQPSDGATNASGVPLERQVLPEGDGWASAGAGTTGGSAATDENVFDVTTRAELVAALGDAAGQPAIVRVHGELLGNADDAGNALTCDDYGAGTGYSLEAYLEAFDPDVWGMDTEPEGEQADARNAASENQSSTMVVDIPDNTTIVGATPDATLTGLSLKIDGSSDVIVRNLNHRAVSDCFPQWDPTDGDTGNWNSDYDMVQIVNGATNIWIDHNYYTDDPDFDDLAPQYFGRPFQQHDGSIDVTNASDLVTVSYNRFADRDKLMLIGSSDSRTDDAGRLRVTVHHNEFVNIGQRGPRLRFGQVDVYNNHYVMNDDARVPFVYNLGVGVDSHIWAEANAFTFSSEEDARNIIGYYGGSVIATVGNAVNGTIVDLLAAYNAAAPADEQLATDDSWVPTLRGEVAAANDVPALLEGDVGPMFDTTEEPGDSGPVPAPGAGGADPVGSGDELAATGASGGIVASAIALLLMATGAAAVLRARRSASRVSSTRTV